VRQQSANADYAAWRLPQPLAFDTLRPIFPMRLLTEGETVRDTYEVERFLSTVSSDAKL
jgi:hypothetical protein